MDPWWYPAPVEQIDTDKVWDNVVLPIIEAHVRSAFPKPDDESDDVYDDERLTFDVDFTNHIFDLLKSRVSLNGRCNWGTAYKRGHAIYTDGIFALKQAAADPFKVFQGRLDPYVYVDILTWSVRKPEHDYINVLPEWAARELGSGKDDEKNIIAFNKFIEAFRRDVIPFKRVPPWANQYMFHNIDRIVQLRFRTYKDLARDDLPRRNFYSVALIYDELAANMKLLLELHKPENIQDIIKVVTGFISARYPL